MTAEKQSGHFLDTIITSYLEQTEGKVAIQTRFPPEPNGYLHIGHAKSICLNFGLAQKYGGCCNLRFDDTNPVKEETAYVDAIKEDVRWLGFTWEGKARFASDYFDQLYDYALRLIHRGRAYVEELSAEEIRQYRGTLTEPGKNSPWRDRPVEENIDLFERMRQGEFPEGSYVLRAKIDMSHPNVLLRDPTLYRIRKDQHHRTGDTWPVYPLYDFAHCLSDAIEGVTQSVCSLEFENNRAVYDWLLDTLAIRPRPYQYEFARLNLTHTVLSKRRLIQLVEERHVSGWDDPRMPTLSGLRRRGYTPQVIRTFCDKIGVAKTNSTVDYALLESCVREELNETAPRVMGVLNPLKVVIENYPPDQTEEFEMSLHPEEESMGRRRVPFSRELWIEREDFMEDAPKKFFRLAPGREVRLRYAYYITCTDVIKDSAGVIQELRCTYDPATRGGWSEDGRKVRGTLHWVSAAHGVPIPVRLYEALFTVENPLKALESGKLENVLNPHSLTKVQAYGEPYLTELTPGSTVQFERLGYFCVDTKDSTPGKPVFNRTATLRDTWARKQRTSG